MEDFHIFSIIHLRRGGGEGKRRFHPLRAEAKEEGGKGVENSLLPLFFHGEGKREEKKILSRS